MGVNNLPRVVIQLRPGGATENAGLENTVLENMGPNRMVGKGRTGNMGTSGA